METHEKAGFSGFYWHSIGTDIALGKLKSLTKPVNGRPSSGMDGALAQDALEGLSECATGACQRVRAKSPARFGPCRAARSGGAERANPPRCTAGPPSADPCHFAPVCGSREETPFRTSYPESFLAQELLDVTIGQFTRFRRAVAQVDDALLLRRKPGKARVRSHPASPEAEAAARLGSDSYRLIRVKSLVPTVRSTVRHSIEPHFAQPHKR